MSTILFSSIANGSTVVFNPDTDILAFDTKAISAASLQLSYFYDFPHNNISITAGGITFSLSSTVGLSSLTTSNITFADGSQLLIGDNLSGGVAPFALANTLIGTTGKDQILGLWGKDILVGGAGNDLLDGGLGADTLKGGLGNDTYVVDDAGDVVDERPTVDPLRVSTNAAGVQGNNYSYLAQISADDRYVVFQSSASNLVAGDTNGTFDIFVKDLQTGAIQRASTNAAGAEVNGLSGEAQISTDGHFVLFANNSSDLVAGDPTLTYDIFVKDLRTGAVRLVFTDAAGVQGDGDSGSAQFSADGRYVLFGSAASNLVAGDTNGTSDIFVKDLQTGAIQRISTDAAGAQGNGLCANAQIAADGRHVLFESVASNLVAGDTNGRSDVFVKDLQTGAIQRVSTDAAGAQGNGASSSGKFSADGRYVVFHSVASNLVAGDTNGSSDIFVKDVQTGAIQRVSTNAAGAEAFGESSYADISADGRYVVFESEAGNLVAGDTNGSSDIFVKDLQTGAIQRVSTDATGAEGPLATGFSHNAQISADGRYVVFESYFSNLVAGDTNTVTDIFRVSNPFFDTGGVDAVQASVTYTLPESVENLVLTGSMAIDGTGNSLNNILYAGGGNNILDGRAGVDTVSYLYASAGVTASLAVAGAQATGGSGSETFVNIENLTGSDFNDTLTGSAGNNVLAGGLGNDTLNGGAGTDTASYSDASTGVTVNLGLVTAQNTIGAGVDTLSNLENLTGSDFNDTLTGNAGNNVLNGGLGNDTLNGAVGTDTASYEGAGAGVTVNLGLASAQNTIGAGTDTLTNIENLIGSDFNDRLIGNAGSNIFDGGLGNDLMNGGGSSDTVTYATAGAGVTVDLSLSTAQNTVGAGIDTLINIENLTGSAFNDTLTGNAGNNLLVGGAGNDTLNGGLGADTVSYVTAGAGVTVDLNVAGAQNTGGGGSDTLTGIENVTGSVFNDTLIGDAGGNVLAGAAGNDVLDGGAGSDTASYQGVGAGVTVSLALVGAQNTIGAGTDTLINIECLTGSSFNDTLTGNAAPNIFDGGLGDDTIDGAGGSDTLTYANAGAGVTVNLSLLGAQNTGGSGIDTLGNLENLTGTGFNDSLTGTAASNILNGGAGNDTLTGGAGADFFVFNTKAGSDTLTDFLSGTDKFRLSQSAFHIGDGDTVVEGGVVVAGPGGFTNTAELVIVQGNIAGALTAASAAAQIGVANTAYALGATALFAVDNGTSSGLYLFTSAGADAGVSAAELTLLGVANGTVSTALADYLFVG